MSPRAAKIARDLWLERGRSSLAILAMALGIASFTAVLASYAIIDRELNLGYLASAPASFTVRMEEATEEALEIVRRHPRVGEAELRRALGARVEAGPAQWRNATFFVIQDYDRIRVSRITPEEGAWPPRKGEVLIERDAFQVAKKRIGETLTVRLPSGAEVPLKVAGRVHDVGQAQARMENSVYAYISRETLPLLEPSVTFDQVKVLVADRPFDRAHIETVANEVRAALEGAGLSVRRVEIPDPGKHPHADLMAMLLLAISTFGLLVLGFAGVLVMNLLTALMANQVREIGIMKAVGARRAQIVPIYLAQSLVFGVGAIALGVPLGLWGSRLLCTYLAGFLNFDMTSFAVPFWVFGLTGLVGLATPVAAAALPVLRATRATVREALADAGVPDRAFGTGRMDRILLRLHGLARPVALGVRNSFRKRTRLTLTLVTLGVAGVFFMAALNVRASMIGSLDRLFAARGFDLSVSLGAMVPKEAIDRAVAATPGLVKVEGWVATEATLVEVRPSAAGGATSTPESHGGGVPSGAMHGGGSGRAGIASAAPRFPVFGLPTPSALLSFDLNQGTGLESASEDAIVINSALAVRNPRLKVGQSMRLRMGPAESDWRIVGITTEAFSPPTAYISRAYFDRAGHSGATNSLRIALASDAPAEIERFREAFDRSLRAQGVRALGAASKKETRYGFDQHMLMIYVFMIIMAVVIGAVGGLGLATTMSLNILERRREMGVMRAIGASHRTIFLIVVVESLVVSLFSWAAAAAIAVPVSGSLAAFIGSALFRSEVALAFDPRGLFLWLFVSTVVGLAASLLPAWRASRAPVREALAFE